MLITLELLGILGFKLCNIVQSLVLIDFTLTVKAAAFIFISGRGSAISSTTEGKLVFFIIWLRVNKLFEPRKGACIS